MASSETLWECTECAYFSNLISSKSSLSLSVNFSQTKCDEILATQYFRPHWGSTPSNYSCVSGCKEKGGLYGTIGRRRRGIFASLPTYLNCYPDSYCSWPSWKSDEDESYMANPLSPVHLVIGSALLALYTSWCNTFVFVHRFNAFFVWFLSRPFRPVNFLYTFCPEYSFMAK